MQKRSFLLLTFAAFSFLALLSEHQLPARATAAQPTARRNLGLFFNKLRAGKTVTVAFFGSTRAAAPEAKTPYRSHVINWLKQQYPQARVQELNAAVTGTDIGYAALRARRDVIAYKPDLVVLDFAALESADEGSAQEESYKKALEGVLRQLLIVPQPPEIVLLQAADAPGASRAAWSETIAAHYQLPTLKLVTTGDDWHQSYGQQLTSFLAAQVEQTPTPLLRNLPNPLVSDEMNYGEFKALAEIKHSPLWKTENSNDRNLPALLLASDKAGATLDLFLDGTVLGLTFQASPQGGSFEVLIDGKPAPAPLAKVDTYAPQNQLQARIIPGGLPPGEHKLTLRVINDKHPKSSGHHVKLGSMLVGGQRPEKL
jgi:hypothetical protein